MEEQSQEKTLLEKIKNGEAKMLPKSYFVGKSALIVLMVFLSGLFAVFLFSFAVFYIKSSGYLQLARFGVAGTSGMIWSFPWLIMAVLLVCLLLLAYVIYNSTSIGHKPALYSFLLIIFVVVLFGLAVARTSFHNSFLNRSIRGNLPVIGGVYRGYGIMHSDSIYSGVATNVKNDKFILVSDGNGEIPVVCNSGTRYPNGQVKEGDSVMVLGSMVKGQIIAKGVNSFNENDDIYLRGQGMMRRRMMNY